jgi:uncharacterized phage protein (TIGR01671 family)
MREILFRGKRKDNGELVYGFYLESKVNRWIYCYDREESSDSVFLCHTVFPETVGQYTGLKDKNGVKIFEGDIVEYKTMRLLIRFAEEYGCFTVDDKFWMSAHNEFSVCGNIYDNLEQAENKPGKAER